MREFLHARNQTWLAHTYSISLGSRKISGECHSDIVGVKSQTSSY